ncbi:MAG: AraC family transcriptional regulator [Spirochaetales bacterium]|nr:AraC family transcriptional regulator [Spirochaetales bacterium]
MDKDPKDAITVQLGDITPFHYILYRVQSHKLWTFPRHRHEKVFEFYYLFEGELTHHFDSEDLMMKEGDLLSIREEDFHSLSGRKVDFFNLIIPVSHWEAVLGTLHLEELFSSFLSNGRIAVHMTGDQNIRILEDLEQLFLYQKTEYGDILLNRFFLNIAAELLGPPDKGEQKHLPLWMKSLILEVEGRMDEALTVADLSRMSDKSAEHLSRSFRRFLGITPSSWLNSLKMERAALMLEHSNKAVLDIALSLGFDNLGYFYRLFRERYGVPPAAYRKESPVFQGFQGS